MPNSKLTYSVSSLSEVQKTTRDRAQWAQDERKQQRQLLQMSAVRALAFAATIQVSRYR